jgi:hypothetical protein
MGGICLLAVATVLPHIELPRETCFADRPVPRQIILAAVEVPQMDPAAIFQTLTSIGAKALYSAILVAIVALCVSEFYKIWFDRSPVLAAFDFVDQDGSPKPESGKSFTQRLVHQEHRLIRLLQQPSSGDPIVTEDATLQFQDLRVADANLSQFDEIKIEAQGFNITDILSKLRNWFRQPNEISGRIDKLDDGYHVFAEWRAGSVAAADGGRRFYNRSHSDLEGASFDLAAELIWHNMGDLRQPTPLVASLMNNFSADEFADFMEAWSDYRRLVPRKNDLSDEDRKALLEATRVTDRLLTPDKTYPPLYNLAGNLRLLQARPEAMTPEQREVVRRLLTSYLEQLAALDLPEDEAAKRNLATLEAAEPAAQRVAAAVAAERAAQAETTSPAPRVALAGASISPEGVATAGSTCCLVHDPDGKRYLLTADYIFAGGPGQPVLSPAGVDGGTAADRVGSFERSYPSDGSPGVALVRLDDDVQLSNANPPLRRITGVVAAPKPGTKVKLFGRSSGLREGEVVDTDLSKSFPGGHGKFVAVTRISRPGDGGAPVIDEDNQLVGMLYAGSQEVSLVLPLKPIFDALQLKLATGDVSGS